MQTLSKRFEKYKNINTAWLVFFFGLLLTSYVSFSVKAHTDSIARTEFENQCSEVVTRIEGYLQAHKQVLLGGAALFDSSESVTRDEWRAYAKRLQIDRHFSGIQGLGFSLLIPKEKLAGHLAEIRAQGFPEYTLRPDGERDPYSSIIYLEPFTGRNLRAFGYDMYSEPVRRAAMEQARDENNAALSGKVTLVQETDKDVQAGALMYVPVYRKDMPIDTVEQRRNALIGWVYSPFRMNDLLQGVLRNSPVAGSKHIHLKIYDGARRDQDSLLYDSSRSDPVSFHQPVFNFEKQSVFNGHIWSLYFEFDVAGSPGIDYSKAWTTFWAGVVINALIFLLLLSYFNTRRNAERMADKLTSELQVRVKHEQAMNTQLALQSTALNTSENAVMITDMHGVIEWVNPAFVRLTGYELAEAIGKKPSDLIKSGKQEPSVYIQLWETILSGKSWHGELVNRRKDGSLYDEESTITPLMDTEGKITHFVAIRRNISERKQAEKNQQRLTRALRLLSRCNSVLIHAQNEQELLTDICKLTVETGGYLMAWVGMAEKDAAKTVRPVAQSGYEEEYLASINVTYADTERGHGPTGTAIRTGTTVVNQDCLTNPDMRPWREAAIKRGYRSSVSLPLIFQRQVLGALTMYSAEPFAFSSEEVGLLEELANDLAYGIETIRMRIENEKAQQSLEFLAHHDALTSLPNRLLLHDRFDQAAMIANREKSNIALLFLDLDNFKHINDSLGHDFGDQLLVEVVQRLKSCVRETDTVSRQGGDEFIILLSNIKDPHVIEAVAQAIVDSFAEPFNINGTVVNTSFSIGISLYPTDGHDFDAILKHADTSLYQAKDAGKNTYRFFTAKMNADALEHIQLQGQLRSAIKHNEFLLHFQPQVDIESRHILGAEALVRWKHPELGMVSPAKFIPLAERSGLIIQIGEWVLNEACMQAQYWSKLHGLPPLVVAVNLSALQFKRGNIVETVADALRKSGLPAHQLELELTESILLHDMDVVMSTLRRLKELGVKLSIDDFGTGYSSLSYLKRLKVDKLKIDQSFVREMVENAEDAAIVQAIIQLGHSLHLDLIAEGVETEPQLKQLSEAGCDQIQGFLFSRPTTSEEFVRLCKRNQ